MQSAVVAYLPCHHVVDVWMPAQLLVGGGVDVYLLYLVVVADREIGQGGLRKVLNLQQLVGGNETSESLPVPCYLPCEVRSDARNFAQGDGVGQVQGDCLPLLQLPWVRDCACCL